MVDLICKLVLFCNLKTLALLSSKLYLYVDSHFFVTGIKLASTVKDAYRDVKIGGPI